MQKSKLIVIQPTKKISVNPRLGFARDVKRTSVEPMRKGVSSSRGSIHFSFYRPQKAAVVEVL
jgi:hypothetical protein